MSTHAAAAAARQSGASRRSGTAVGEVCRAELRKLAAQLPCRVLVLACALGPFVFGAILALQSGIPGDTLLGVWVHSSGYAVSLVVLSFGGYLGFPVVAGVLAGDSFSSEDRYGTWKTLLTRSCTRGEVFAGKLVAIGLLALGLVAVAAVSSLLAGLVFTGDQSLVGLGGNVIPSGRALWLTLASWALNVPPVLGFAGLAVLFSVATRNGIMGVLGPVLVGLAMQLLALVGNGSWMHIVLLASAFDDWHGLLSSPSFYEPLAIDLVVSVLWLTACLAGAWLLLRKRDFAGTPVAKRAGWVVPARAVGVTVLVLVALGAAGGLGPVAITRARLQGSMGVVFERLTRLQQRELGRPVPADAALSLRTTCFRHVARSEGPGDDWSCSVTLIRQLGGSEPFSLTPVVYDVSVKSNGCYKAQAPPTFIGQQMMTDAHGHSVVNPLFTIYACFDPTASAPRAAAPARSRAIELSPRERKVQHEALQRAERAAGASTMKKIRAAEAREQHEAEHPVEEGLETPSG